MVIFYYKRKIYKSDNYNIHQRLALNRNGSNNTICLVYILVACAPWIFICRVMIHLGYCRVMAPFGLLGSQCQSYNKVDYFCIMYNMNNLMTKV